MKHYITYLSAALLIVLFTACNNNNNAITPAVSTPTGNNNANNVNTNTNFNSIGISASWTSSACQAGQTCLTTVNTAINSTVTICFSAPPVSGVYQLVSSTSLLTLGKAVLTVMNPPGQTAGSIWYSTTGTATVSSWAFANPGIITASFTNIPCLTNPSAQDTVFASGNVGCL